MNPLKTFIAGASVLIGSGPALAQIDIVLLTTDVVPGSGGAPLWFIGAPRTNSRGELGFLGQFQQAFEQYIYIDGEIVFRDSSVTRFELSGITPMGFSDAGGFVYTPSIDGRSGVWTDGGMLIRRGDPAPGWPGQLIVNCGSASMTPDGHAYWRAFIGPETTAMRSVLYTWDGNAITPVLAGGDRIDGEIIADLGIPDYEISDNHEWTITELRFDAPSATDTAVAVNQSIVAREGSSVIGASDPWAWFDTVSINDSGDYVIGGGTMGSVNGYRAVLTVNGAVVLREGDVIDGVTFGDSIESLNVNNNRQMIFRMALPGPPLRHDQALFFTHDIDDVPGSSMLLAKTGDQFDSTQDGVPNREFLLFFSQEFTESGLVYFGSDVRDLTKKFDEFGDRGIISIEHCRTDLDGDRTVGAGDVLALLTAWGPCATTNCLADINVDRETSFGDLLMLLSAWGACQR